MTIMGQFVLVQYSLVSYVMFSHSDWLTGFQNLVYYVDVMFSHSDWFTGFKTADSAQTRNIWKLARLTFV